jgi:TatD DNase family protein
MRFRLDNVPSNCGWIDIHCHRLTDSADCQILSLDTHELADGDDSAVVLPHPLSGQSSSLALPSNRYFSLGIHPWFIERQDWQSALQILAAVCRKPNMLAVGECGLDKCIATPMNLQIEVFTRQIELAECLGKPLIIHCVKAFNELMQIKKSRKADSVWIVHGFNANPELAAQLIKQGCYLSFGAALLNSRSHAGQALAETPRDHLFLETDTADVTISEIYAAAAKMLDLDVAPLRRQILGNFKRVFLND